MRGFLRHSFTHHAYLATNEEIFTSFVHSSRLSGNEREDFYVIRPLIQAFWQRMRGFLRHSFTHHRFLAMNERIFTSFVHSSSYLAMNERIFTSIVHSSRLSGNEREDSYVIRSLFPAFWQRTRRFLRHSFTHPRFLATNEKILTSIVHSSRLSGNEREDSYVIRSLITPIWQRTRGFLRQSSTHHAYLPTNEEIFTSFVHSSALSDNE